MSKETEKKGLGWFKAGRAHEEETQSWESIIVEKEIAAAQVEEETAPEEILPQVESANKNVFSKENQDKVSLDLIVAVENLLKDRQLVRIKQSDLAKRLLEANDSIGRYKQDLEKRDELISEKNKEIQTLENSLTNKQMSYDQLLEDYKEFQQNSNNEYENISNQLETAQDKYDKLNEEFTNSKYEQMRKVNELEERIRSMEIENKKYATQNKQILEEKNELMQTINEFTERMSFSFTSKLNSSNSSEQE
jgi:predicted phage tail protein